MSDVYLDGRFAGTVSNPKKFVSEVKAKRRAGNMSPYLNIRYRQAEDVVFIYTERNRVRRPLIIVESGKSNLTDDQINQMSRGELKFSDLVKQGVIEYLDAEEEEDALIALNPEDITEKHTHLEINPLVVFGLTTSLVPFANFNQASRLNAGQKMQKQAISMYTTNYFTRSDTGANILDYPQKSIVTSETSKLFQGELLMGQNIVIAIINYDYNMEDALVLNKGSVDRGLGRITHFRPYATQKLRYPGGQVDEIKIPDKDVQGYTREQDYRFLGEDGLIHAEADVHGGDVLIGKTSPPRFLGKLEAFSSAANVRKDTSVRMRYGEDGTVSKVIVTEAEDGSRLIKVDVRESRKPQIGDKLASRYGQKGVIGALIPAQDLPFSASGITPDLIFSPNGLPKRMTVAHLMEALAGKIGALNARNIDGTPFMSEKTKDLKQELLDMGFRDDGTEILFDGRTGVQYPARIMVGNMHYLRLKHQVDDKIQSRARGPVALLTHQPTEGKSKEGGLRLGEMEKDTFVAHGSSLLMKERFDSDRTVVWVCERCGGVGVYDSYKNKAYCTCGEKSKVKPVEMSYAFKLFLDELRAMHIRPQMLLEDKY